MFSLVYRGSEGTKHKSAGIGEQSIFLPLVHQTAILWKSWSVHHVNVLRMSAMAFTCGLVDSTTAQDRYVTNHNILEQVPEDWIKRRKRWGPPLE